MHRLLSGPRPCRGVPEEVGVGGINVPCAWVQLQMPLGPVNPVGGHLLARGQSSAGYTTVWSTRIPCAVRTLSGAS